MILQILFHICLSLLSSLGFAFSITYGLVYYFDYIGSRVPYIFSTFIVSLFSFYILYWFLFFFFYGK